MDRTVLGFLCCPKCGSPLESIGDGSAQKTFICSTEKHSYPVVNGIPRFVDAGNYASSFGFQWKKFSRIQLDSQNGTHFSEERFQSITGWTESDLRGKWVLDAGCGAGRFSEIALKFGANLIAFDLSEAVEAWRENVIQPTASIMQASIFSPPFTKHRFDYVYCIGVIQHTPDPILAIRGLCALVKPGGSIGLWIYERDWKSYLGTLGFKYVLRPLFSRFSQRQQFQICKIMVDIFFPIIWGCRSLGLIGKVIMRMLPVASAHIQSVPMSAKDFKEWILLDTFDMYSPAFDQPQKYETIAQVLREEGFEKVTRHPHGGISITAEYLGR